MEIRLPFNSVEIMLFKALDVQIWLWTGIWNIFCCSSRYKGTYKTTKWWQKSFGIVMSVCVLGFMHIRNLSLFYMLILILKSKNLIAVFCCVSSVKCIFWLIIIWNKFSVINYQIINKTKKPNSRTSIQFRRRNTRHNEIHHLQIKLNIL